MMGKKKMAMKRGGSPVKKRGGGMLIKKRGGGAMGPKKKMAGGGMMGPKKKMAKGGGVRSALEKLKRSTKPMTGRSAAAKKAMGRTKATATAIGRFKQGKGNPAGKDMSTKGALLGLMKGMRKKDRSPMSAAGRKAMAARLAKARKAKNTKGR
jgi:hypothetical protein